LNNDVLRGIESARAEGCDLLLLGARYYGVVHRFLFPSISERLITVAEGPAVAVIRPAIPLASRFIRWAERTLKNGVPQLDRNRRVALVERVQSSSQWDFDFIALICLSTLIATLGLMLNSPAVVIGAMLVAPLMTPLLGAGLSLVQGNVVLLGNAVNAVFRGFLLAVVIACLVGLLTPGLILTSEMLARGSPGIFDLLVAFTSGIAAAYAIGRPNLLSALPGVAIAASLVPPISTCGLGLVLGRYNLAIGAGLLFLTNIIAIVLGAACSLFAVGIRGTHEHGAFASWAWRVALALVLLTIGLGIYEALPSEDLPDDVRTLIAQRLSRSDAAVVSISVDKYQQPVHVDMVVKLPQAPEPQLADELLEILKQHYQPQVQLQLQSLLVSRVATSP
jgi:uncharacterized hydrophobic protein (TIGR00271 family)